MVIALIPPTIKNGWTNRWIVEMLDRNDPIFKKKSSGASIVNIVVKEIGERKGIMSYVFRILLEFDNGAQYSFVIKKPTLEPLFGLKFTGLELNKKLKAETIQDLKDAHNYECEAYALIKNVKNVPIPKIYCLEKCSEKSSGFIAMEDFYGKATTIGIFKSPTQQHCLNIARHLGHFQAQMNKNQHKWKGKHLKVVYVEEFDNTAFTNALENVDGTKPEFEKHVQLLSNFDVLRFYQYSLQGIAEELDATALCHGDLWSNNMMMKISEDGSVLNEIAAIIDWQRIFEGNPYIDLARFLNICFDADIRRSCEKEAINLQYDTFCEASNELGLKVGYTREEAHKLYDYAFTQQSIKLLVQCNTIKSRNPDNANEEVLEAQYEKMLLRCKFALDDSFKYVQKYGIVERFGLKN